MAASHAESQDTSMSTLASQICDHIASIFSKPTAHPPALDVLVSELSAVASRGGRVFLYGVGREGLMMKALCMRLAHLGLSAHSVFDMTTPPIAGGDLLLASAGPGGFSTVDAICSVARSHGGRVVLLTAQPEKGTCARHASAVAHVPAQTMAEADDGAEGVGEGSRPLLPMGSVYEGAMFVLFEMVVYRLGEALGESPEAVRSRHTNLE
ncbi:3-hexulose-6-phosphate isomerase [Rhodamnia argentea]|uniref:3-hexulose-6-phosphate isomerase n=1 Tax=Rhodamnia argentea TaxID=178133 RepID=A0A8B8PE47_9MYRT|nr:3-hexulose-6-phosphate isomerase [Rhodamnia argentea]